MRKWMMTALLATVAVTCFGCGKSGERTATEVPSWAMESKENDNQSAGNAVVANEITYQSDGAAVTDDTIFGKNVYVFSPEDDSDKVQKKIKALYDKQMTNQFGEERYAVLLKPGNYNTSLEINVGFYTQVAGLGILPTDTNVGKLWVNADWMYHNATCNFWRSAENFSIREYCMWANSQAVSLRRMDSSNGIVLSDGEGWSSGGFMADCKFGGTVSSGSQQQYLFRNDTWRYFENGVWNMVFTGVDKTKISNGQWPYVPYTKVDTVPVEQEKPYLCYDEEQGYGVIVPDMQKDSQGISWSAGTKGTFYSLNLFYIAHPKTDDADTINAALKEGKHILLTPGVYHIDKPIAVDNENTMIYGMGLATLVAEQGNACMQVADVSGVKICGVLFEAGNKESDTLLQVGAEKTETDHADNPMVLSDVYFRVGGGKYAGKVKNCVTINANDVIGDNLWVWRGDHSTNVGWDVNTATNGIVINGDDVIMYGLFVEHFQEYQTIWNGNGGRLYFYQSEMPYDAPSQKQYMSHDGTVNGYASFKVGDDVTTFEGYGLGIYCYNRDAEIEIFSAVEVPDVEGVKLHNVCTVKLNGKGQIAHIINDAGNATVRGGNAEHIMEYENGVQD